MNQLATKYNVSENTVLKWKEREELHNRSSRPHPIYYSLSILEQEVIKCFQRRNGKSSVQIPGLLSSLQKTGSLKKELGVETPFEAVEKWYELKPKIFLQKPLEFINKILLLHHQTKSKQDCLTQQPCET